MSIKTRLLTPIATLIGLTIVTSVWIGGSALYSAGSKDEVVRHSLDAITIAHDIGAAREGADAVYAKVAAMTRLYTQDEIAAPFEAATAAIHDGVAKLKAVAMSDRMLADAAALGEATAAWERDARIVLGLASAAEVPTVEQMRRGSDLLAQRLEAVSVLAQSEARLLTAEASAAFEFSLMLSAAIVTVLLGVVGLLAARAVSRLGGALMTMSGSMTHLAGGDADLPDMDTKREDELGDMARAIAVFRDALLERGRLEQEQSAEMTRRVERQQASDEFQQRVREVVNAAVDGDFSNRLDLEAVEEEHFDYARRVNKLVAAVDEGVGATKEMLAALAQADLTARMEGDFRGVFAELRDDANATAEKLTSLVEEVRAAAAKARDASHRVGADARALSERGEQQAAALEETSATMEEISESVQASSQSATEANRLADEATNRAMRGKEIMVEAVEAVREIEESSGKITEIISVIDGIAFQTNLLALNAAVEAARAGDAGKGFAVVASEVRTLAQRSADAARDIKSLIDVSSASVGQGVKLVQATGGSLDEIRDSIERLAAAIAVVSSAAREQSNGVAEVTSSVSQIDEMTRHNAELSRDGAENGKALESAIAQVDRLIGEFRTAQLDDTWARVAAE